MVTPDSEPSGKSRLVNVSVTCMNGVDEQLGFLETHEGELGSNAVEGAMRYNICFAIG